ncbi:MAG: bifunctional metallophosphatase/5'-nucleotidase, partial [Lachnospiraceae bacterium]|nr:bifunctional metallophosphatase/5'-nucleotidase [Lachnospiraceae bacterium]
AAEVEEAVSEAAAEVEEAVSEAAAEVEEAVTEAAEVEEAVSEAPAEIEEATEVVTEAAQEQGAGIVESASAVAAAASLSEEETEAAEAVTEEAEEETEAVEAVTEAAEEALSETAEEEDLEDLSEAATEEEEQKVEFKVELNEEPIRGTVDDFEIDDSDIVVLYNNDVHGGISADKDYSGSSRSLGYAGLAGVKADVMEKAAEVTTVDLGDAIQGSVVTTETIGQAAMDLMEMVDYDVLIPGNHEFDYGMDVFLDYANNASAEFISANFIDNRTGEPIFDGYTLEEYDVNGLTLTVGYVGMTTPETIAKSTPTYFQDEDGNYIYGFDAETPQDLYDDVQEAVDAAYADGADIVIALGHMGDTGVEPLWSSQAVIENTTGISAFLDGHAHSVIPGNVVQNKDGEDVLVSSTGTKLEHIGLMKMDVAEDGTITISTGLVDRITDDEKATDEYNEVYDAVQELEDMFAYLFVVEGTTDFDLVIYDPETEERLIRKSETNLGDFLSDVYRNYFDADIAVLNGGSIRANIEEGEINFMDIITVYPWNTPTGVVEVPGQVILDMLEMGAHLYPEECGGWILPSGMSYMIDSTIPSSVNVNSDGEFVSVDGEYRVKNVMVGDEPLDLEKNYKLAINTYYSQEYGDGMTMFKGCKVLVPAEGEDNIIDHDVVVDYIKNTLNGVVPEEYADPYGQGRFTIITEENKDLLEEAEEAVTEGALEEAVTEAAGEEDLTEAVTE